MSLTIICPNLRCRSVLQVPQTARGKKVRCGKCGDDFMVPSAPPTPKPAQQAKPTEPAAEQTAS